MKIVFICIVALHLASAKGPVQFTPCKIHSSDFNQCVLNIIQRFIVISGEGIPDYNVPAGDPYVIPSLFVGGGGGSVNVDQNYTNLHIYGISKAKLLNMTIDGLGTTKLTQRLTALVKKVTLASHYEMKGRVLVLPLTGSGKSVYTLDNLYVDVEARGVIVQKKGKKQLRLKSIKVNLKPTSLKIELENLFDGNKQLGEQMNNLLNENWEVVFEEMRAPYEAIVSDYLQKYVDKMLSFYQYEELVEE